MAKQTIPAGWKSVKFEYLFDRLTQRNTVGNTNVLTISARHGLINQEDFFNKSVASEDLATYYLLERGDFVYNKSYSAGYNYGAFKQLTRYDNGVISPLYICFSASQQNQCPDFYVQYFESMLLDHEIKAFAQEGARNHGLLNIAIGDFFSMSIPFPPLTEQRAIAEILTTADRLIAVKERFIAAKRKQKRWLMQNLLTGKKWKTVKFSKMFDRLYRKNDAGNTNVLTISAWHGLINQEQFFNKSVASEDLSGYYLLYKGDFAYNKSYSGNYKFGAFKRLTMYDSGVVSPLYICFTPSAENFFPEFYAHFLSQWLWTDRFKLLRKKGQEITGY
jgi:type I restriction enzyme S subunit